MLQFVLFSCIALLSYCFEHYQITLDFPVNPMQIAQYKDTIRGFSGYESFVYNSTSNLTLYGHESPSIGSNTCDFIDYTMIQKKLGKMWHFRVCNISGSGLTAAYSLLRFENLETGLKFESNTSTFGSLRNDEDFPWYYSRAARQMVMPLYFLKSMQKIAFNVNSQKMIMNGFKPGRGYQKSTNRSSTTLYRLEGYPDDNSTQQAHSQNLPANMSQACLAANGKYIVTIVTTQPRICIYNTSSNQITFSQLLPGWEPDLIKLKKVNETHVLVARGGPLPEIRVYDLRVPAAMVQVNPQLTSHSDDAILTPYLHDNTLVCHWSAQPSKLHMIINFEIKKQIKIVYLAAESSEQPVCEEPNQIINSKYCVLCGDQCNSCDPFSPNLCVSCNYGFVLHDGSCVSQEWLASFSNSVTWLRASNLINFDAGLWELVEDLWLLNFHSLRFENYAKSHLKIIQLLNNNRYFPSSLNPVIPPFLRHSGPNSSRTPALPIKYTNYIHSTPLQHQETLQNVVVIGLLFSSLIYVVTYAIWRLMRYCNPSLVYIFINGSVGLGLVSQIVASRLGYVGWLFWNQIKAPSFTFFHQKLLNLGLIVGFFTMVFYAVAFYPLAQWHYRRKKRSLGVLCLSYRSIPQTFRFFRIRDCLILVQSFLHLYLYEHADLCKMLLLGTGFLKLFNLMAHYKIYEQVLHYFTALFYQVSLFLFAGVLLLDQLQCPELFEVRIKLVQFVALLMLTMFAALKMVFSFTVGFKRFLTQLKLEGQPPQLDKNNRQINKPEIKAKENGTVRLEGRRSLKVEPKYMRMLKKKDSIVEDGKTPASLAQSFLYFMKAFKLSIGTVSKPAIFKTNKVSPNKSPQP